MSGTTLFSGVTFHSDDLINAESGLKASFEPTRTMSGPFDQPALRAFQEALMDLSALLQQHQPLRVELTHQGSEKSQRRFAENLGRKEEEEGTGRDLTLSGSGVAQHAHALH